MQTFILVFPLVAAQRPRATLEHVPSIARPYSTRRPNTQKNNEMKKKTHTHTENRKSDNHKVETSFNVGLMFLKIRLEIHVNYFGDFDLCTIRKFRLILFRFKSVEFLANY